MAARESSRQEIAERLREVERECDERGYPWMTDDLILALGYRHDYEADSGIFDRLADLIDPICEVNSVETYCNELGQLDGWEFHLTCGHSVKRPYNEAPAYCQECGARVVER